MLLNFFRISRWCLAPVLLVALSLAGQWIGNNNVLIRSQSGAHLYKTTISFHREMPHGTMESVDPPNLSVFGLRQYSTISFSRPLVTRTASVYIPSRRGPPSVEDF